MNKAIMRLIRTSLLITFFMAGSSIFADGGLDTSFGSAGTVLTPIPGHPYASILGEYIQVDGKIVAVGNDPAITNTDTDFVLARYLTNGTLDATFGTGGIVDISLPSSVGGTLTKGIAVQSDGKIVVAGGTFTGVGVAHMFAARLTATGALDVTFGTAGIALLPNFSGGSQDFANATVIDVNGNIVLVGNTNAQMGIARLTTSGSLDTTFNGTGQQVVHFSANSDDHANAVALLLDGLTIVAAGSSTSGGAETSYLPNFAHAIISPTGTILSTTLTLFSTNSTDLLNITTSCNAVLVQPDGKIVMIGETDEWTNGAAYFALARYESDTITLDTTFLGTLQPVLNPNQNPGTFIAPSNAGNAEESYAYAGGLQSDGKILAGGYGPDPDFVGNNYFVVGRFNGASGTLDTSFVSVPPSPTPGFVYTSFDVITPDEDEIQALAIQGNGNIVVGGTVQTVTGTIPPLASDFALARYLVATAPLVSTTIYSPSGNVGTGILMFTGTAENPSIIDLFVDGPQIGSTTTIGATNAWSFSTGPFAAGPHTITAVGRYRDDGHVNLQATGAFDVVTCSDTFTADDQTLIACSAASISGTLTVSGTYAAPVTFAIVPGSEVNGTVTAFNSATGAFTFTFTTVGTNGSFEFTATDDNGCPSTTGTITLVSSIFTANDQTINACDHTSVSGTLTVSGTYVTPITFTIVPGSAVNGTVTAFNSATGAFTFTFTTVGTEGSFEFTATDANGCVSSTGTITLASSTFTANDQTINACDHASVSGRLTVSGTYATPITFAIVPGSEVNGTVTAFNSATGAFTFTFTTVGTNGSFEFTATDANGCVSSIGTVTLAVSGTFTANDLTVNGCLSTSVSGTVTVSGTFATPVTFSVVPNSEVGGSITAFNSATGAFTFAPVLGVPNSFQFFATDANGCISSVGTVTITTGCCTVILDPFFALIEQLYWGI